MANRHQRLAKKRARREKRVTRRVAYLQRTAPKWALSLPKISEALLDFAAPLLVPMGRDLTADASRPLLTFAATVWNLTRLIDAGKEAADLESGIVDAVAAA